MILYIIYHVDMAVPWFAVLMSSKDELIEWWPVLHSSGEYGTCDLIKAWLRLIAYVNSFSIEIAVVAALAPRFK